MNKALRAVLATVLAAGASSGCTNGGSCTQGEACSKSCPSGQSGLCVARGICKCVGGGGSGDGGVGDSGVLPVVDDCRAAEPGDLVITELLADGEGGDDDTEFVEIVNAANEPVSVRGLVLNRVEPGETEPEMTLEAGCIPARGAVAFFRSVDRVISLPPTGIAFTVPGGRFAFPNSRSADYTLNDAQGGLFSHFEVADFQIQSGVSVGRPTLDSVDYEPHDQIAGLPQSPGRCPNGGAYHLDCDAPPPPDGGVGDGGMPICDAAQPGELVLNEVLVDGAENNDADEFAEVVNTTDRPLSLAGVSLSKDDAPAVTFDAGCIPGRGAVAIAKGGPEAWQWDPLPSPLPSTSKASLTLANSGEYTLTLVGPVGELSRLVITDNPIRSGVSLNRSPDVTGELVVLHDTISPLTTSPAACPNGGRYVEDCAGGVEVDGGTDMGPPTDDMGPDQGPELDMGPPPPMCDPPLAGDLVLNEALIDGAAGSTETDEFVELVNTADRAVAVGGVVVQAIREGRDPVVFGRFDGGCLVAGGAGALRRGAEGTVFEPADALAPTYVAENVRLANGDGWTFVLRDAGNVALSTLVVDSGLYANGVSANRDPDLTGDVLVRHSEIGAGDASPARCPNGALYSADCQQ